NSQGLGLGLPIVHQVVSDLQGEIRVNSDPVLSPGTEFILILNLHVRKSDDKISATTVPKTIQTHEIPEKLIADFDPARKTILIIEDNISMMNYLSKKLLLKYNVHTACNGHEALLKLKNLDK